jgi:hypothetical protein
MRIVATVWDQDTYKSIATECFVIPSVKMQPWMYFYIVLTKTLEKNIAGLLELVL